MGDWGVGGCLSGHDSEQPGFVKCEERATISFLRMPILHRVLVLICISVFYSSVQCCTKGFHQLKTLIIDDDSKKLAASFCEHYRPFTGHPNRSVQFVLTSYYPDLRHHRLQQFEHSNSSNTMTRPPHFFEDGSTKFS